MRHIHFKPENKCLIVFERLIPEPVIYLCGENPQWNDKAKFSGELTNGKSRMGSTFYFGKWGSMGDGRNNAEIMARGRNGVDRNMVYLWENGMTGQGKPTNPVDAQAYHMLKENLVILRDPRLYGWMEPSATA